MTVVLIISKAVLRRLIRLIVLSGVPICIGLVVLVWLIWLLIILLRLTLSQRCSAVLTIAYAFSVWCAAIWAIHTLHLLFCTLGA